MAAGAPAVAPLRSAGMRSGAAWTHLIVVASFGLLLIGLIDSANFTVDDTFISFRYAENLAAGKGLVYNPGERVEGYSNLLWTLLLAAYAKLGWNQHADPLALLRAAKVTGFGFALATLALLAAYVYRMRRDSGWGRHRDLLALAVLCTAATYSFPVWGMSGLETPICAFAVTLAGILFMEAVRAFDATGRASAAVFVAAGAAFGLLSWVRPEQIFIWALALAVFLFFAPPALRRAVLLSALVTLAIHAALLAWRWSYYGALIPNSVVAKSGGGLVTAILGLKYAIGGLVSSVGIVGLGFLGLPGLVRGRHDWQFLAIYCAAYVAFVLVSGGDWMPGYRFYVPVLPLLWLLGIAALVRFAERVQPALAPVAVGAIVAALAVSSFALGRALVRAQLQFPTGIKGITWHASPGRIEVAREIARIAPDGSLLALFEAGYVPYFNPELRVLDDSGLMDARIARLPGRHMHKMTAEYFLRRDPDFYLMMVRGGIPSGDGVTLFAAPEFRERYAVIRRFNSLDRSLRAPPGGGEVPMEEDLSFVLYRRVR